VKTNGAESYLLSKMIITVDPA